MSNTLNMHCNIIYTKKEKGEKAKIIKNGIYRTFPNVSLRSPELGSYMMNSSIHHNTQLNVRLQMCI